jgi:hypothetical protein
MWQGLPHESPRHAATGSVIAQLLQSQHLVATHCARERRLCFLCREIPAIWTLRDLRGVEQLPRQLGAPRSSWPGQLDDAFRTQRGDLGGRHPEKPGEDLVGVMAERRSRVGDAAGRP